MSANYYTVVSLRLTRTHAHARARTHTQAIPRTSNNWHQRKIIASASSSEATTNFTVPPPLLAEQAHEQSMVRCTCDGAMALILPGVYCKRTCMASFVCSLCPRISHHIGRLDRVGHLSRFLISYCLRICVELGAPFAWCIFAIAVFIVLGLLMPQL